LSGLVETRSGAVAGHGRRVADLARRIALRMGLSQREAQDVFVAGLLHEIGKTGLPDDLIAMPESLLKGENLGLYRKYPVLGEQLLMPLEELREAARIIRALLSSPSQPSALPPLTASPMPGDSRSGR